MLRGPENPIRRGRIVAEAMIRQLGELAIPFVA
jgi:hypothetical protein